MAWGRVQLLPRLHVRSAFNLHTCRSQHPNARNSACGWGRREEELATSLIAAVCLGRTQCGSGSWSTADWLDLGQPFSASRPSIASCGDGSVRHRCLSRCQPWSKCVLWVRGSLSPSERRGKWNQGQLMSTAKLVSLQRKKGQP